MTLPSGCADLLGPFLSRCQDLVITVDAALAHLSWAMGIPTLLLLLFQPDFRWMLGRVDNP